MFNANKLVSVLLVDEALANANLYDRINISVPSKRILTDAGQMRVPCTFARTGTQPYLASQIFNTKEMLDEQGLKAEDVIQLHRDEATVFDEASMETFRSAPVTIGHPKDGEGNAAMVTAENAKDYQVGMLEGMPVRDEETLGGTLILSNKEAIDALETAQELSAGYTCDIVKEDGKYYQRNIKANHIAIVAKGRAGSSCRISDEEDGVNVELKDAQDEIVQLKAEAVTLKDSLEAEKGAREAEVTLLKAQLKDATDDMEAKVTDRCGVIEKARLIADIRIGDIGELSTGDIKKKVIASQLADMKLEGKDESYINAVYDMLVDSVELGDTPMGRLFKAASVSESNKLMNEATPVKNPVEQARDEWIAKQTNK